MLIHNFRFSVRHLLKQKTNSAIHILGLTLAITVCLLIGLFVQFQLGFDSYHHSTERIYRINSVFRESEIDFHLYATPLPLAQAIRGLVAGIEKVALTRALFETTIEVSPQKILKQNHILAVEPDFLNIFDIDILQGDGHQILAKPHHALISESTAKKLFGDDEPIGKTIKLKNKFLITVGGIFRDPPSNTSLPASMLISYLDNDVLLENGDTWFFGDFTWVKLQASTYIRIQENADIQNITTQLKKLSEQNINSSPTLSEKIKGTFEVQPLREIHFDTEHFGGGPWVSAINRSWLWFFVGIGGVVLLLACVNFLNLSTARAFTRAKEVGIRKSIGAKNNQLVVQFLMDAFVIITIAAGLAILIASLSIDRVNTIVGAQIPWQRVWSIKTIALLAGGIIIISLLTGIYPAWFISRFNPIATLKSNFVSGKSSGAWLRKSLVTVQFVLSTILIIAVLVIAAQVNYIHEKDLGFEKDNIVTVAVEDASKAQNLLQGLHQLSGVKDVSLSRTAPISNDHWWNSISQSATSEQRYSVCAIHADERFFSFYNLKLLSGRIPQPSEFIPESLQTESGTTKVVVNEDLLAKLNLGSPSEAIGKHFWWGSNAEITGVVSNFHTEPLMFGVSPTLITQGLSLYQQVNIKIEKGSNFAQTIEAIEREWKKHFPESVFEVKFLDQQIKHFYQLTERIYSLFKVFALMAILISCLGLWGLVSYVATQRTKEISIRKVFGASVQSLLLLLSRDFIITIGVAFLLASPLGYLLMRKLLTNFAYRVDIGWDVFAVAVLCLALVSMATLGFQIVRTATTNPSSTLKNE